MPSSGETTTRWLIVGLIIAAGVTAGMQVGKVPPAIPVLREELGIGLVEAGWVASLFNVVGAGLGLVVGIQTDRLGARNVMFFCLGALGLGSAIGALAHGGELLLLSRAIESIGFVGITVSGPRLIVAASAPKDTGRTLGFWGTYMPAGMALAMFAAPGVMALAGWRAMWWGNAALILAFLAVIYVRLRPAAWPAGPGRVRSRVGMADTRATLSRAGPWLLGGCFALYTIQWFAVMAWLPTFLIEVRGEDPASAAVLGAAVVAVNMAGSVLAGSALHRGFPRWVLIALAYAVMLTTAASVFSGLADAAWAFPLILLFSGLGGMLPGATLAGAATHATTPGQVGTTSGTIVQGANLGSLAGPPTMAALAAASGWHGTWILIVVCGSLGLLLAGWLGLVERRLPRTA
jgi:MFS family permease